jgi:glycosyltransferase involved in cell wall biosynthesis
MFVRPTTKEARLAQRLQAVSDILLAAPPRFLDGAAQVRAATWLDLCVRAAQSDPSADRIWLLCTAVFGAYPTADDVTAAGRYLQLNPPAAVTAWLRHRAHAVQAEIAEERWRTVEREVRARNADMKAVSSSPRADRLLMRARAAGVYVVVQVPAVRPVVRVGRRGLRAARALRASSVTLPLRRQFRQLGSRGDAPDGSDVASGPGREVLVVTDRVVVDVDHSARHELHTGIQQVVRRTLPLWERDHPILAVAWTDDRANWRTLSGAEKQRVLRRGLSAEADAAAPPVLVIPWRTVVILAETPPPEACGRLAALAQYSGNAVVAIGYDCIPVVSADLVPASESQRFARYLTVLKYARRIAGVSRSATAEFAGFAAAVPAQGLPAPTVLECALPASPAPPADSAPGPAGSPLVVCVGSLEPRKNHLALLYASERLWREGLDFRLLLMAGSGWGEEIPAMISRLQQAGRPLTVRRSATDAEVTAAYQTARFSVLPSLHEGYGLPVAESLAVGTPVITANYGSTQQIAADGGALTINPRDDEALLEAMRRLLTDDHLLLTLRRQAQARPTRTWEHYAADLWDHLVEPVRPEPTPHS